MASSARKSPDPAPLNAMTVDLEDWAQAVLDPSLPVTDRVIGNCERVLVLLAELRVRATFFALGKVCERFPDLLPRIAAAGHEIASHGYGHELVYRQSPDQFERDVARSIEIIEQQVGVHPAGYRAPAFSITRESLWAGPILARLGIRYSSSIFPIRKKRYGIANWPRHVVRWPDCDLIEYPLTTLRILGRNVPMCGGGYMRLWPVGLQSAAIRQMNRAGWPAIIYLHPCELLPDEISGFRRDGVPVKRAKHLTQSIGRSHVEPRLRQLLSTFRFGSISDVLSQHSRVHTQSSIRCKNLEHVPERLQAIPAIE